MNKLETEAVEFAEAIKPLLNAANQKLFERYAVLTKTELESRHEVFREDYERRLEIEGRVALEIAKSIIRPVVIKEYLTMDKGRECSAVSSVCLELEMALSAMNNSIVALQQALSAHEGITSAMAELRRNVDALEGIIDDSAWPLPKYREMLFIY